jgi:hypothetical protein
MEKHGGMILTGENSFVPQIYGNPVNSHLVAKQDEVAKDMMNFLSEGRHAENILSPLKIRIWTRELWVEHQIC